MKKVLEGPITIIAVLVALAFGFAGLRSVQRDFQLEVNSLRRLNDSTVALLATERLDKQQLKGLLTAAEELNGKLVAGVQLLVKKRDTTIVHDTLKTDLSPDSTRVATFRDSTFAGTIHGTVTAPPCCAPLQLQYTVDRPAFSPSVGFVQRGDQVAAVVVWRGERVEAVSSFAKIPVKEPLVRPFVEAGVSTDVQLRGAVGAALRLSSRWAVNASVQQDVPTNGDRMAGPRAWITLQRKW